jgi:hypothetical protein
MAGEDGFEPPTTQAIAHAFYLAPLLDIVSA